MGKMIIKYQHVSICINIPCDESNHQMTGAWRWPWGQRSPPSFGDKNPIGAGKRGTGMGTGKCCATVFPWFFNGDLSMFPFFPAYVGHIIHYT